MFVNPITFPAISFVRALGRVTPWSGSNPWSGDDDASEARRRTLIAHLQLSAPRLLLVTDRGSLEDAGATGLPGIATPSLDLLAGRPLPAHYPLSGRGILPRRLWAHIHTAGLATHTLSFAVHPWSDLRKRPHITQVESDGDWLISIIGWYPHLVVIALSADASRKMTHLAVDHHLWRDDMPEEAVSDLIASTAPVPA